VTITTIPLFPLRTVLFPDGPLPLRVFEPRYLDMISKCMKEDSEFGVILAQNEDRGAGVSTHSVGTLARITDWYQGSDGILGITACGTTKFFLRGTSSQTDGLMLGEVDVLERESELALPADCQSMASLLKAVVDDLGRLYADLEKRYDDATWVGCRLAEILPIEVDAKQHCLELDDPIERLAYMRPLLQSVGRDPAQ
jgi:Lon protease-like protein